MKVAQSCLTLCNPWTACGILQARILQGIFPTEGSNPGLLHCRQILYKQSHKGSGLDNKASACNVGNPGLIPGLGRCSGEGNGKPIPVLLPGKFHGQRSLVGYNPWGHKDLETTEGLHFKVMKRFYEEPVEGLGFLGCQPHAELRPNNKFREWQ